MKRICLVFLFSLLLLTVSCNNNKEQCNHENAVRIEKTLPSCTKEGSKEYYFCDHCNKYFTDNTYNHEITEDIEQWKHIDKIGHSFKDYISDNNATCTQDGTKTSKCEHCEETKTITDTNSALGHTFNDEYSFDNDYHYYKCLDCDEICSKEVHNYDNNYICLDCSYKHKTSEGLLFKLSSDNTYFTLNGIGECTDNVIYIPATVLNKPVKIISSKAFMNNTKLTEIYLPNSIISIESNAFEGCNNLTSVHLSNGIETIKKQAFLNCINLKEINTPESIITIESKCFEGCTSLSRFTTLSDELTIGVSAFLDCNSLKYLEICKPHYLSYYFEGSGPNSKSKLGIKELVIKKGKSIGNSIFSDISSLEKVVLLDSDISIGLSAFQNCTNLKTIIFGGTISSISEYAFDNTYYYNDISNWEDSALYLNNCLLKVRESKIGDYEIKDNTTILADSCFKNCELISSITVPDSVTTFGFNCFGGCLSLKSLTLPFIGNTRTNNQTLSYLFGSKISSNNIQASLETINILDGCSTIGSTALSYCSAITSISIPDSVTSIGPSAFSNCTSLKSITIPDSVTSIGPGAFHDCTSLGSITIPDSVTSIGSSAFEGCNSLQYNIYDNARYLGNENNPYLFLISALSIKITSCLINKDTKYICASAFKFCYDLKNIKIPNGVVSIADGAFVYCTSLSSIVIPNSVVSIGSSVFYNCTSLMSITVPFIGESRTTNRYLGFLFGSSIDNSSGIVASLKSIIILDGCESIEAKAFYSCSKIITIVIPSSVVSIGENAFYNCVALNNIFYTGTEQQYDYLSNKPSNGTVYYYSETNPTENNNYWHYVNDVPTIW